MHCVLRNTFEQFCINFTNETLQATFNKHVFMGEVKIYESEGLQVSGITWPDNSDGLKVPRTAHTGHA